MTSNNYLSVLKKVFSFEDFLSDDQKRAFEVINEGKQKNIFISLKSQGGKSFCYQLQGALQQEGIILVISPSLLVIKTQLAYLNGVGLNAKSINSVVDLDERRQIMQDLTSDPCTIKFLFITNSMIRKGSEIFHGLLVELLEQGKITHCFVDDITKAEHFRPQRSALEALRTINSDIPWIVLTTASKRDIISLESNFGMAPSVTIRGSSVRSDIFNGVVTRGSSEDESEQAIIIELVNLAAKNNNVTPRGLIFVNMNKWESITSLLNENAIGARAIYAKLENREEVLREWINGDFPVLVANGEYFGYGINFDFSIDFVFHKNPACNMNSFYQEFGRSRGTPGKPGISKIFRYQEEMDQLRDSMSEYENTTGCRRRLIESHFDDINYDSTVDCGNMCDNCVSEIIDKKVPN